MADDAARLDAWLRALGLEQYGPAFAAHAIDLALLPQLTDADLKEIGVAALGHRKKLLAAAAALVPGEAAGADAAPATPPLAFPPPHLATRIRQDRHLLAGERKLVTVLFADVKGSTELLVGLDPEAARALLDPVIDVMMRAVHRYEGTVNKVLGDGIMAVFGAPIAHEDHAARACYAALAMQQGMRRLAARLRTAADVEPQVRIGLHSGEVVVGSVGSDLSVEYDAVGPTVHVAARMEQLASPGTTRLTAATAALVDGLCQLRPLGAVPVKGLPEPLAVFELLGAAGGRRRLRGAAATAATRFVGRGTEMDVLAAALRRADAGEGQLVSVVGEPGVGKSRLCLELLHTAASRGWLTLEGGAIAHGRTTPYLPLIDLLRGYFELTPGLEPPRARERVRERLDALDGALAQQATPLLALLDLPVDDPAWADGDPARRRSDTIEAVRALIVRESAARPVVVLIEDLHWADGETLAVLDALAAALPQRRLLLVVNARPEFAHHWPARAAATRIALHPLPSPGADALLVELLGDSAELAALRRSLVERATGNPFFLEECVRALVDQGALVGTRGQRRLVDPAAPPPLPASVQAVLASRIDRLAGDVKRVLQTASVIGKDFPFSLLAAILDHDDERHLTAALATLRANEFIYETRLFPEPEYTFAHALTHEVALGGLLLARRRELHARIVSAIERLHATRLGEHVDLLALHAMRGEVWDKAVAYARQAGERAAAHSAHREAITHFEQALAALAHLPPGPARDATEIALHLAARDELFVLGGEDDAVAVHVDAAVRLAQQRGDSVELAVALLQRGGVEWLEGRYGAFLATSQRSLAIATGLGDPVLQALARYRCGIACVLRGDMAAADAALDEALGQLDTDAGRRAMYFGGSPFSFAASFRAIALAELGAFAAAEEIGTRGLANARALDSPYTISVSCFGLAHVHLRRGTVARALEILTLAEEQYAVHGVLSSTYWAAARVALAAAMAGDAPRARRAIALLEEQRRHQQFRADVFNLVLVGEAACELGDAETAQRYTDLVIGLGRQQEAENAVAHALATRARLLLEHGGPSHAAVQALDEAAAIAARHGYRPLDAVCAMLRARLAALTDGDAAAAPLFAAAAAAAGRLGMNAPLAEARAGVSSPTPPGARNRDA